MVKPRTAVTLLELVIVVAVIAVLIALTAGAVHKVREAAARIGEKNQMRQVILALHHCGSTDAGRLPRHHERNDALNDETPLAQAALMMGYQQYLSYVDENGSGATRYVREFFFEGDPSLELYPIQRRIAGTCVAVNFLAFDGGTTLHGSFPDGLSNTIGLSERYGTTRERKNEHIYTNIVCQAQIIDTRIIDRYACRRFAMFAEAGKDDVHAVTTGNPPVSRSSHPGLTFQVKPPFMQSDGRMLQSTRTNGLTVALMDGSVRTISPQVSEEAFWGSVTPAGGESVSLD